MENFVFALNATMPIFIIILLGWFLRRMNILTDAFCGPADKYVFRCALPVSCFLSIAKMDVYNDFEPGFFFFCLIVTIIVFSGVWGLAWKFKKNRLEVGAFAQASARSSAAILGIALAENIYGNAGLVPMMILAAVPFFNIFAVLMLTFSPQSDENGLPISAKTEGGSAVRRAFVNVLKNPIIIGILAGVPFALTRFTFPKMISSALTSIGGTATPIALLVIGATFSGADALKKWKPAAISTFIKLFVLPAIFLPIAMLFGFRNTEMVAILIMLGAPTTVSSYIMAKNMHQDHVLTSNVVLLTTLFSSVSLTLWLFVLKNAGVL